MFLDMPSNPASAAERGGTWRFFSSHHPFPALTPLRTASSLPLRAILLALFNPFFVWRTVGIIRTKTSLNTSIVMTFEPLSTSQRRGAIVVAMVALLSALALAFIALRTIRLAVIVFLKRDNSTSRPPEILFFCTQLGHYAGCLILSNMFISAAVLVDFSWVSRSGLNRGSTCSAQAVLMQIGIWGSCWFTAAHSVHTLSSLGFHIRPARWRSSVTVALGWTIACVAALAPLRKSSVYGPTGTSCSIAPSYPKEIFILEALPIILGAFVSTAVYSVIFFVLHGKLSVNSTQKLRGPNSTSERGEDRPEEYHKFICMIIYTMFWFPLAFVLLLLPFCVTHILMYAGHSVPSASSVFADVCVSMLGFVNVVLLRNTFRVVSPVYHSPRTTKIVADTVETFGYDTSGESPVVPQPAVCLQHTTLTYESSRRTYNSTQSSSNHWSNSSWSRLDSNTELHSAEKASYGSTRAKVVPLVLNSIMPPAELSRYPRIISPQSNTKRQDIDFQPGIFVDSSLRTASLGHYPPRVPFVTRDTRHEPSTRDEKRSFHPMTDTDTFGNGAREPTFKSKAPPALNLSRFSVSRPKINPWRPDNADESNSRPCSSYSSAPTMTLSTDSDSDHSIETIRVCKGRPLPQVPEPSDNEHGAVSSCPFTPRRLRARSCMTVTTVWSQESAYTMSQSPDTESQEAYRELMADVVVPGVMLGDQADVGEVISRQATPPPGSRGHRPETLFCPTKHPARFTNVLSQKSRNSGHSTIVFAPDDSVV